MPLPDTTSSAAPDVSVVVAAYGAREFIARAIRSALASTGVDVEVIVVDDCSTDGTADAVESQFAGDPRVRTIRRTINGGPGAARNDGFAASRGRWIAVVDADDAVLADRLARLTECGDDHQCDIVADNITHFDLEGNRALGRILPASGPDEIDLAELFRASFKTGNDYGLLQPIFRREFLMHSQIRYPDDMRHGEDYEFVAEALYAGARYRILRQFSGYLYTQRASGLSRTRINDQEMIDRVRTWFERPGVRRSKLLRSLLRGRIGTLQALQLNRMSGGSGVAGRLRILALAIRSRAGRAWLRQDFARRLWG